TGWAREGERPRGWTAALSAGWPPAHSHRSSRLFSRGQERLKARNWGACFPWTGSGRGQPWIMSPLAWCRVLRGAKKMHQGIVLTPGVLLTQGDQGLYESRLEQQVAGQGRGTATGLAPGVEGAQAGQGVASGGGQRMDVLVGEFVERNARVQGQHIDGPVGQCLCECRRQPGDGLAHALGLLD